MGMTTRLVTGIFVATWGALVVLGPLRPATLIGGSLLILGFLIVRESKSARWLGLALAAFMGYSIFSQGSSRLAFFMWVAMLCLLVKLELEGRRKQLGSTQ